MLSCLEKLLKDNHYGIFNISSNIKITLYEISKKLIESFGMGKIDLINDITDNFIIKNHRIKKITGISLTKNIILKKIEEIGLKLKTKNYD